MFCFFHDFNIRTGKKGNKKCFDFFTILILEQEKKETKNVLIFSRF